MRTEFDPAADIETIAQSVKAGALSPSEAYLRLAPLILEALTQIENRRVVRCLSFDRISTGPRAS